MSRRAKFWELVRRRAEFFIWSQRESFRMTFSTRHQRQREARELLKDIRTARDVIQQKKDPLRDKSNRLAALLSAAGGFGGLFRKGPRDQRD